MFPQHPVSLTQTSSEGRHSVRISGLSTIDFRAGFSRKPTMDFKQTSSRPVQGQWGQPYRIVKSQKKKMSQLLSVFAFYCSVHVPPALLQLCINSPGIPTHILLNTTGLAPPARPDRLELLSIMGEVIKTLPIRYYPDREPYSLWNITEFIPPNEAFFLRVTGYDADGFVFQRVSSVSFSNIIPSQ